jgi:hypothetical protein
MPLAESFKSGSRNILNLNRNSFQTEKKRTREAAFTSNGCKPGFTNGKETLPRQLRLDVQVEEGEEAAPHLIHPPEKVQPVVVDADGVAVTRGGDSALGRNLDKQMRSNYYILMIIYKIELILRLRRLRNFRKGRHLNISTSSIFREV